MQQGRPGMLGLLAGMSQSRRDCMRQQRLIPMDVKGGPGASEDGVMVKSVEEDT